jgi:alpha-ketoglutarate-dependent taurine dioxygenase
MTEQRYGQAQSRFLSDDERTFPVEERETPLVIEPRGSSSLDALLDLLSSHSEQIIRAIAHHGAVLLRGFEVKSDADFERAVLSLRSFEGISNVFMAEEGRTTVPGTRFVLYTNANFKTGGTLTFGRFHTENYFIPDVPKHINFFCQEPSWLGGETGLINVAKVYADLPGPLQKKLEERAFWVESFPLDEIQKQYSAPLEQIEQFCRDTGMEVVEVQGRRYAIFHKPSVIQHPLTQERALAINFAMGLEKFGLATALRSEFLPAYAGWRWAFHRLNWHVNPFASLLDVPLYRVPDVLVRRFAKSLMRKLSPVAQAEPPPSFGAKLEEAFTSADIELLARSMRQHYSAFKWLAGDVLLVDNLKMAHSGMPGLGARTLRAMICNPLRMRCDAAAPGLHVLEPRLEVKETLGSELAATLTRTGARPSASPAR